MKISTNIKRIRRVLWNRRKDIFSLPFWRMVGRVAYERFNIWQRVDEQAFLENLRAIENRPWNLHVELSNICNANCIFCAYQYQKRREEIMAEAVFLKTLDDYCAIGGGDFMLTVSVGDPAVDPHLIQRIREARSRPEIASIETISNAIALKPGQIEALIRSGISRIQISIGPMDAELYEKIFRNKSYGKVLANVRLLLERNLAAGCPVEIKLAFRSNLSMNETLGLPDYQGIKHLPHSIEFNTDFDTWSGEIKQGDLLPGMHLRPLSELESEPCYWLYDGPIVFVDGSVGLCGCRDYNADSELIVGNIMQRPLLEIWQSEEVKELRERFTKRDFPQICRNCSTYANLDMYRSKPGSDRGKLTRSRFESK
ncbi:MAG: radical SAM/SPASM domain-containing protein [Gallionellaceae bacterium]